MSTKADAHVCAECGWQTEVWVEEAPGPSGPRCKVCDQRTEIDLLRESRRKMADEIDRLRSLVTDLLNADDWREGSGDRGPWVEARRAAEQAHREWIGGRP